MIDSGNMLDVTAVTGSPYFQEYRDKGATSFTTPQRTGIAGTLFHFYSQPSLERGGSFTPIEAETSPPTQNDGSRENRIEVSPIDTARDTRISLLAMKFEGQTSRENEARMEILTRRLRCLSPRVTHDDIAQLDAVVSEIEDISVSVEALKEKYGVL